MTRKHYRIKSERRFGIFIIVIILILVGITGGIMNLSDSNLINFNNSSVNAELKPNVASNSITVKVRYGDTLWDYAKTYMPKNMDTRRAVYIIAEMNKISPSDLQPGMEITIPQ